MWISPGESAMPPDLLRRTSALSATLTALLCMWLFGNLYEAMVWNPQLLADPRPGLLVGAFAVGSPVFYYLPWAPAGVALTVVMRVRYGPAAPAPVRRAWTAAAGLLVVAVIVKILLIALVNPAFRDPALSRAAVHDHAVLWAFGNGVAVVTVAAAVLLITLCRRPPAGVTR